MVSITADASPVAEMNTTPLIDVMLVLLIMFIITLPVMTHGVHLDLPHGPAPQSLERPPVVELGIDFDGTVTWNDSVVADMATLERFLASSSAQSPQPEIHLRPDRRARYEKVAQVMAATQRHHLSRIGFVNGAEFRD